MTDQQIVSALRVCGSRSETCKGCPYFPMPECYRRVVLDAAARLEELCRGGSEKNDHIR